MYRSKIESKREEDITRCNLSLYRRIRNFILFTITVHTRVWNQRGISFTWSYLEHIFLFFSLFDLIWCDMWRERTIVDFFFFFFSYKGMPCSPRSDLKLRILYSYITIKVDNELEITLQYYWYNFLYLILFCFCFTQRIIISEKMDLIPAFDYFY